MREEEFQEVKRGAIIRNRGNANSYVVESRHGAGNRLQLVAVRTVMVTNPSEWDLVKP